MYETKLKCAAEEGLSWSWGDRGRRGGRKNAWHWLKDAERTGRVSRIRERKSTASNNRQWLELMESALLYEERATAALVVDVENALHEHANGCLNLSTLHILIMHRECANETVYCIFQKTAINYFNNLLCHFVKT